MAAYPPIDVYIRASTQQFMQQMRQATFAVGQFVRATTQAQTAAQRTFGAGGGMARNIGSFYLFYKALNLSSQALRTGYENAADMDLALTMLGSRLRLNTGYMETFRKESERVAAQLGKISATQVMQGTFSLANVAGMTPKNALKLMLPFNAVLSNMATFGNVDPGTGAEMLRNLLNAFKAGGSVRAAGPILGMFERTARVYNPKNPGSIAGIVSLMAPTLRAVGMSPEDIFTLGAFQQIQPMGTRARASQFIERAITAGALGHGKTKAAALAAAQRLGIRTPGDTGALFSGPGGTPSLIGLAGSMAAAMERRRAAARSPEAFIQSMLVDLKLALGTEVAKRSSIAIIQSLEQLKDIRRNIETTAGTMAFAKTVLATIHGSVSRMKTNIASLLGDLFLGTPGHPGPAKFVAGAAWKIGSVAGDMTQAIGQQPWLRPVMLAAIFGPILGIVFRALAPIFASTFVSGVLGRSFAAALSVALANAGTAALVAAAIAATVVAGIELYKNAGGIVNWLQEHDPINAIAHFWSAKHLDPRNPFGLPPHAPEQAGTLTPWEKYNEKLMRGKPDAGGGGDPARSRRVPEGTRHAMTRDMMSDMIIHGMMLMGTHAMDRGPRIGGGSRIGRNMGPLMTR